MVHSTCRLLSLSGMLCRHSSNGQGFLIGFYFIFLWYNIGTTWCHGFSQIVSSHIYNFISMAASILHSIQNFLLAYRLRNLLSWNIVLHSIEIILLFCFGHLQHSYLGRPYRRSCCGYVSHIGDSYNEEFLAQNVVRST